MVALAEWLNTELDHHEYADRVVSGLIPASKLVRAQCQKHLLWIDQSKNDPDFKYYFDEEEVDRVYDFCCQLKHYKGSFRGDEFKPLPWQKFILAYIFGWKHKESHLRVVRRAYVEVPRKNGKTFLASVIALYLLTMDEEGAPEIYSAATTRDQAKIVWEDSSKLIKYSPLLDRFCSEKYSTIFFDQLDGKYKPLSADPKTHDGLNPHAGICDEVHEWPNADLWHVIEDGQGSRMQPLMFGITTAGFNTESFCYQELHTMSKSILLGDAEDDSHFAFIACMDPEDDWKAEDSWWKANPCLGQSKTLDYMRQQFTKALNTPSSEYTFKTKQLNLWTQGSIKWIDMDDFEKCRGDIDLEKLRSCRCFGGLDLSSHTDITSACLVFPPNQHYSHWTFVSKFYYPDDNYDKRSAAIRGILKRWADDGLITETPGGVVDFDWVVSDFIKWRDEFGFNIESVGFDPWGAVQIATTLMEEGFEMVKVRQGPISYGPPMKEFERLVLRQEIMHMNNPVFNWMLRNTVVRTDVNNNLAPDKEKSADKIDGVVAFLMALARAIASPLEGSSVMDHMEMVDFSELE